jgi:hypothetical protein
LEAKEEECSPELNHDTKENSLNPFRRWVK